MIKVAFIGDSPSRLNVNEDLAFVGARCFYTIIEWIKYINPDYYICINSNKRASMWDIQKLYEYGFKIIALGNKSSKRLDSCNIEHLKIDHPSGLNRKLNNKDYIDKILKEAYTYVRR